MIYIKPVYIFYPSSTYTKMAFFLLIQNRLIFPFSRFHKENRINTYSTSDIVFMFPLDLYSFGRIWIKTTRYVMVFSRMQSWRWIFIVLVPVGKKQDTCTIFLYIVHCTSCFECAHYILGKKFAGLYKPRGFTYTWLDRFT
jgi:hypothetical protein